MRINKNKILAALAVSVIAICYYIYLYNAFLECNFNSDTANFVLEGNDILHGNFLLSDWNLTGISFIATDLVFYTVAALFAGISLENAVIAGTSMVFLLIIASALFIVDKGSAQKSFWGLLVLFSFAAFPAGFALEAARYHTACVVETLLAFYILNKYSEKESAAKRILFSVIPTVMFTLAAQSDPDSLLIVIGPVTVISLWRIIYNFAKTGTAPQKYRVHFIASLGGMVLSFFTDKLFYLAGGANKNSFLDSRQFVDASDYGDKLAAYFKVLLILFNADYSGKTIFSVDTFFYFIRVVFIIITSVFVFYNIVSWVLNKNCDYTNAVLSMGVFATSLIWVITNIGNSVAEARYIGCFPAIFAIIFVRTVRFLNVKWQMLHGIYGAKGLLLVILLMLGIDCALPLPSGEMIKYTQYENLAETLEYFGLTDGYASFWNASHTTVISNNRVHVRATLASSTEISMHNWFCKTEWYTVPANFVVVSEGDGYGMTYENMENVLGEPVAVLPVDNLQVLVYDYDISTCLFGVGDALSDGKLTGNEWYGNETSYVQKGVRIIEPGGILWGPYSELSAGHYIVTCNGEHIRNAEVDVYSTGYGGYVMKREQIGEDLKFEFELDEDVSDIEIRVFNTSDSDFTIKYFAVERIKD